MEIIHRSSGNADQTVQFGPYKIEPLIAEAQENAGTVYRVTVEADQATETSYHQVAEEFYFVISGSGVAILDGQEYPIAAGDFLRLPPGTRHSFVTTSEPLQMLDIHVPGCRPGRSRCQ